MHLLVITQKVDKDDENLGSFHQWLVQFSKHNAAVTVIARSVGSIALPANVSVYAFGGPGVGRIRRIWRYEKLFRRHYDSCDAVFFHMIPEFVAAAIPFLVRRRAPVILWYAHKSVTRLLHIAERMADYILTPSPLSFRLPSKKVIYTGHAIDTDYFTPGRGPASGSSIRLLSVGRIAPVKNYETLIEACAILKTQLSRPCHLTIVGGPIMPRDTRYLSVLQEMVRRHGLDGRVSFAGAVPFGRIASVYRNHDIFVSLSRTGSVDKAVLEAMACGLSVISANESFRDILPPQYFLSESSPGLLAERISMLAYDTRPAMHLRDSVVRSHSLPVTIAHIMDVFEKHAAVYHKPRK